MYLVRKTKKMFVLLFFHIFYSCFDNFVYSGDFSSRKILFTENFIQSREFYPLKILSKLMHRLLSSAQTFIRCIRFYPVSRLFCRPQTFIQCEGFYPEHRYLYSVQTFIQCIDFYPVLSLISRAQTSMQRVGF